MNGMGMSYTPSINDKYAYPFLSFSIFQRLCLANGGSSLYLYSTLKRERITPLLKNNIFNRDITFPFDER